VIKIKIKGFKVKAEKLIGENLIKIFGV